MSYIVTDSLYSHIEYFCSDFDTTICIEEYLRSAPSLVCEGELNSFILDLNM